MFDRYSGFPPEIFEMNIVRELSESALRLYFFLCRRSDQKSNRKFAATDREVTEQTGASTRALSSARRELERFGLIACERTLGSGYTYILCDVKTRLPYPGDSKQKPKYTKQGKADKASLEANVAREQLPHQIPEPHVKFSTTQEDTSFFYGHNVKPPLSSFAVKDYSPFSKREFGR